MTETKAELERKLKAIHEEEKLDRENERKRENYLNFQKREVDHIIGKAHYQSGRFLSHTMGECIDIHGSCGVSYNARPKVTGITYRYFHNVWAEEQRNEFQMKLNKLAEKEAEKIAKKLNCVLEIMGLQTEWSACEFPEETLCEVRKSVWEETVKVLDKYKDKDFMDMAQDIEKGNLHLSHGSKILLKYLTEKRKHLLELFDLEATL